MPACWAAAGVGHSVIAQRRWQHAARAARRGRGRRGPSAPGRRRPARSRSRWRWIRSEASISRASASSVDGKPSRCASRACVQKRLVLAGQRGAQQRPRLALEDLALQREQQRRGVRARLRRAPAGRAGPRGSSRSAGGRSRRRSWRLHLREPARRGARAGSRGSNWRSSARRSGSAPSSSFCLVIGGVAGDLPAHGEALEQELDRALPGVLAGEDVAARDLRVLQRGSRASARRAARARCRARRGTRSPGAFRRSDFFAIAGTVACPAVRKPTRPREVGRGERVLPGVWRLRLPLDLPGVPALQRLGARRPATGSCSSTPGMHEPRLDEQPRAGARPHRPPRSSDVRLIVITHAHVDHCGQAPAIAERAGCEVWMHPRWTAARARPTSTARSRSRSSSGVPEEPLRRWAERRRGPGTRPGGRRCTPTATSSRA